MHFTKSRRLDKILTMEKISVVIPAYNEENNIERTIVSIVDYLKNRPEAYEILVSDDGSLDQTAGLVERLAKSNPKIKLIRNSHAGKAATISKAVNKISGTLCLLMDADGATDVSELPKLREAITQSRADIAIGSREGNRAQRIGEPGYRHLMGRIFNYLIKLTTGLKFEDTQCGFKLFKSEILQTLSAKSRIMNQNNLNLKKPLVTAFDVELLVLAREFKYKVVEAPIKWRYVKTGNISPLRDSFGMIKEVFEIRFRLRRNRYSADKLSK